MIIKFYLISDHIDYLTNNNEELKLKLQRAKTQYNSLMEKMKKSHVGDDENSLNKEIKSLNREIFVVQNEIDGYKRDMDHMKNKLEFKLNLEKSMNIEGLVRVEKQKNKDLLKEYESLIKQNTGQKKVIDLYDKTTGYSDKIDLLKTEIKILKENLKDYYEKYLNQERYLKQVHEKISTIENKIRKLDNPKIDLSKKTFTAEELNQSIDQIKYLKTIINDSKAKLKDKVKVNEEKLTSYLSLNKKIEQDYKDNERVIV